MNKEAYQMTGLSAHGSAQTDPGRIMDAHVHLPVCDGCVSLQQKKEKLLQEMRENQVARAIVISDSVTESPIGSMEECAGLFEKTENVSVVGGISPFYEFQSQLGKLKTCLEQERIIGIKLFTGHEAFYLTDGRIKKVYELAMQYHVPVLFHSGWENSQYGSVFQAAEIAKNYPELKLVCCHCFYPHIENCQMLIPYPNVYFEISSVADDAAILEEIEKEVRLLTGKVPGRVIFGSDYSGCSQKDHIEFVRKLGLDKETEDKVFWKNAKDVYSL